MLFDQIPQQCLERLTPVLFLQDASNITRNRIGSSGADFPADFYQLIFGQTDGDLRSGHTGIIPLVRRYNNATRSTLEAACEVAAPQPY